MVQSVANSFSPNLYGFDSLAPASRQSKDDARTEKTPKRGELTQEQQRQVEALKKRDREVRQHEQAHLAVGRDLVLGGPSYTYETGPDNKQYAVAGEVSIDTSPGRTPEETIPKAQHIRETALAPAEPSPQDRSVAAKASSMESEARHALMLQQREEKAQSTQLYQGVQQNRGMASNVGKYLDLFA